MLLHCEFGPHGEGKQGFNGTCCGTLIEAKIKLNNLNASS